ncbi:MAG TPA: LON peptidase substrate-binding domain-containing protein [Ktedonobacterales bacterium]|nr:LON peptidase substrate-binding domain-containing protein [Ktedonobacterales bacterium]
MSDELCEIPLVPLNAVLFPGMALPLHVFEPRYRQMTKECLDNGAPIGIVLALPEGMVEREASAHIGTMARICDYQRLPDGRYNLLTVGTQRFEVVEVRHDHPYISGLVRLLKDQPADDLQMTDDLAREGRMILREYLQLVLQLLGSEDFAIEMPEQADDLSFLIAASLSCEDNEKQRLLEITSVSERLATGVRLLREEVEVLRHHNDEETAPPLDDDRSMLN